MIERHRRLMPEHLVNISAYDFDLERLGGEDGVRNLVEAGGVSGTEMLTGHFPAPAGMRGLVKAVHLPYAVDWFSGWNGRHELDGLSDEQCLFLCYGRDRGEMVATVAGMIANAAPLRPAYGVMHAASPDLYRVFSQRNGFSDRDVLAALAELLNSAVSAFPGGEPPFPLALENLWWPGLRLMDRSEVSELERRLEFESWTLCLDTGHLMNALRDCREEEAAVEGVERALDRLGDDSLERIGAMHLHLSLSADYQERTISRGESAEYLEADIDGKLSMAYPHFGRMDWHSPFETDACLRIVDRARPAHVTHEFVTPCRDELEARLAKQTSHFRAQGAIKK